MRRILSIVSEKREKTIVNWKASVSQEEGEEEDVAAFQYKECTPSFPTCLDLRRATRIFVEVESRRLIGFPSLNFRSKNSLPSPRLNVSFGNAALSSFHKSRRELICNIRNGNGKVGFGCLTRLSFFECAITKEQQPWKNLRRRGQTFYAEEFPPSPSRRINRCLLIFPCTHSRSNVSKVGFRVRTFPRKGIKTRKRRGISFEFVARRGFKKYHR